MSGLSDAEVCAWLQASCAAQGVPEVVTNPATLSSVAALVTGRAAGPPEGAVRREGDRPTAPATAASADRPVRAGTHAREGTG